MSSPKEEPDRRDILLRAAYDLLTRCDRADYVLEASSTLIHYDDADCDGYCLRMDIAHELNIEQEEDPIPTKEKQ